MEVSFIEPEEIEKLKSVGEAKLAVKKAFCPSKNNVRIKRLKKGKKSIVLGTDTAESPEKLKDSEAIKKKFDEHEMTKYKPRIMLYDIPS